MQEGEEFDEFAKLLTDKSIIYLIWKTIDLTTSKVICSIVSNYLAQADPGGGAHLARAPPNGRGPMIFYALNANFS